MRTLPWIGVLNVLCFAAPAQAQQKSKGHVYDPSAPAPTGADLRAMALTNFAARCAIDYQWNQATNAVAQARVKEAAAKARFDASKQKDSLEQQSKQSTPTAKKPKKYVSNETALAERDWVAHKSAVAGLELQKIKIEETLHQMYPKLK